MKAVVAAVAAIASLFVPPTAALAGALTVGLISSARWECTYANSCSVTFDETVDPLIFTHYSSVAGFYTRTITVPAR